MEKPIIVVRTWKIYVRRLMDGLTRFLSSLVWSIRDVARPRRLNIKINPISAPPNKDRATSPPRRVLRIRRPPSGAVSTELTTTESTPRSPATPPARAQSRRKRAAGKNIRVTGGLEICKACRDPINNGKELARCNIDSRHTIHRECIPLMKSKCPHCGGYII
jgi:hypothetical protein